MKTLIKSIAAAAIVASFSTPTFATVQRDVIAAAGTNSNVQIQVSGNTVTLTGYVNDTYSRQRAQRAAESEGFKVRNCLLVNN